MAIFAILRGALRESGARDTRSARGESWCAGVARRARLRGLFASSGDFCTKLASDALFARVFARVARAVMGKGRAMGVESRGCLDAAYCELDLRVTGLRKRLWWPAQPGRTEPSGHEEACPDTVGTAPDETEGGVAEPTAAAFVHD